MRKTVEEVWALEKRLEFTENSLDDCENGLFFCCNPLCESSMVCVCVYVYT